MVQRVSPAPSDLSFRVYCFPISSTHSHQGREARIGIVRNGLLAMRFREREETSWSVFERELAHMDWWAFRDAHWRNISGASCWTSMSPDSRQFFQRWTWEHQPFLMSYDRLDGGRKRAHSTGQSRLSASQVVDPHRVATQRHSQSLCHPGFISSLDLTSFVTSLPPGAIFFLPWLNSSKI